MDTQPDKEFKQRAASLLQDCEYSAFVLGNTARDAFVMTSEVPEGAYEELLRTRGMVFLGVITVKNGCPYTVLRVPLAPASVRQISEAYLRCIEENFAPKGDGADFLESLYQLPDTREN